MLMKAIRSVFNFYMLYVQPFIGLVLAGYGVWNFSGSSISALLEPASYFVIGTSGESVLCTNGETVPES